MKKKGVVSGGFCLISAITLIVLLGCGKDDIVDKPLQGVIQGNTFSFASGYAYESMGERYVCKLYNIAPPTGTYPWDYSYYSNAPFLSVTFWIPMAIGTYPWNSDQQGGNVYIATLYNSITSTNLGCDETSIKIDSISGGNIVGTIVASWNGDPVSWVNFSFTIPIEP